MLRNHDKCEEYRGMQQNVRVKDINAVNPQVSHFDMEKKVITHPGYDKCEQNTA